MNIRSLPTAPVAALAALLLAAPAVATIVRSLTLDQMAVRADVVVHARVVEQRSAWNDEKNRIYTVTRVEVVDAIKGGDKPGTLLDIRQIGGSVDGITQSVAGNARLRVGEEVIVFLDRDQAKPLHYVIGMAQGKFAVDRRGAEPRVVRDLEGLSMAAASGPTVADLKATPKSAPVPEQLAPSLPDFVARVRAAAAAAPVTATAAPAP